MAGATYVTRDGDMLDQIAWRIYGYSSGAVEAILEANRGLADYPPILPAGVIITMPNLEPQQPASKPLLRLWD